MFNTIALRKAKIVYNFGLSECKRVNVCLNIKCKVFVIGSSAETSFSDIIMLIYSRDNTYNMYNACAELVLVME